MRAKIGPVTKILPEQIRDAQNIIDYPEIDFKPFAFAYIDKIEEAIRIATGTDYDREQYYDELVVPLSNIKGQAGMMGNWLASYLSDIILKFIERFRIIMFWQF